MSAPISGTRNFHMIEAFPERFEGAPRLASYKSRQGGSFAFADELAEKRQALREVEEALAKVGPR
ncbi:hypothetical protein At15955_53430 (plasmid) [Agrobacterium tumefaciens]|uniref:Uncharacterized protein n=3 Tax=Rhizobiaceae TaxID=82115 RepID=A0A2L2LLJ8_AGRTU|nr:hypothetical protein Ach5_52790 [Agrobacterium tumefaciens]AVH45176.1 hypothetical protein At1D1609_51400 [Agrobacterium tumefaciens]CUX06768.1 hypothetical protein AGR1C_pTi0138 [Agrobacterium fabacearum TT111]CVI25580.1 hypothetical protein AGR4A_pTi0178 [Agrobacterium tumefaciens str. B6]AYM20328.1 hypothetical protein At15955_53430 [Agrobacterium tumefaciens]